MKCLSKIRRLGLNRFAAFVLAVLGAGVFFSDTAHAAPAPILKFDPADVSVQTGQQVSVNVQVDPTVYAVSGVEFHINYDPAFLRLDSITKSDVFSLELQASSINNSTGEASATFAVPFGSPSVTTLTSDVATLSFYTLASGVSSLNFDMQASAVVADGEPGNVIGSVLFAIVSISVPPDTTAPSVPSNLNAAAVSQSEVNLSWMDSSDNVAVAEYRIERCQGAGCSNFVQIKTIASISYQDTGLTAGTVYQYRIRAADIAGNTSGYSSLVTVTTRTAPDTTPPTVSLSAPPAGTTVTQGQAVTVSATATDTSGIEEVQFVLDGNNIIGGDTNRPYSGDTNSLYSMVWSTAGISPGNHTLTAIATDGAGNQKTSSGVAITIQSPPPAPTPPTATLAVNPATITVGQSATIQWTSANATSCTGANFSTGNQTSGTVSVSPTATTTYGLNCSGTGGSVTPASVTVTVNPAPSPGDTQAPTVPTNFSASADSSSKIDLAWAASTDNSSVAYYQVERCRSSDCSDFVQIATATATSYTNANLSSDTTYRYRIRAVDTSGNLSGYSGTESAKTDEKKSRGGGKGGNGSKKKSVSNKITKRSGETTAPYIRMASPRVGSIVGKTVFIEASATDKSGMQAMIVNINGISKKRSNGSVIAYMYAGKRLKDTVTIEVRAYDALGNRKTGLITVQRGRVAGIRYF